jgi:hypothetical protein
VAPSRHGIVLHERVPERRLGGMKVIGSVLVV